MPEIKIRLAGAGDIAELAAMEHNYSSDYVWQIDIQADEGQVMVNLRESRLPRSVRVDYPHKAQKIAADWQKRDALLVAELDSQTVGYVSMRQDIVPYTTWVDDLGVVRRLRRQGIGTALVLAAENWAVQHDSHRMVIEMQSKNHPAIRMAQKLGFDFSGFHERYFGNLDIALFFSKVIG